MTENNNTANTIHMTGVQGTVKWFSNRKGFGFITSPDALSEEIFVHQTGIVTDGQFRTLEVRERRDIFEMHTAQNLYATTNTPLWLNQQEQQPKGVEGSQ